MLSRIHVKNLILIDEAEIELREGFHVLTGETGAGKSVLLGSVEAALGGKITKEFVREGCEYGLVELAFEIETEETKRRLSELGFEPDEGQLVIARKIKGTKCTNRVNGEMVTAGELRKLGEVLIDIYGQHEHQTLLSEKNHLLLLDDYGDERLTRAKAAVQERYRRTVAAAKEYESYDMDEEKRLRELDLIQYEIDELERANLQPGEDETLEQQYRKCANARKIMDALSESYETLADDGASAMVSRAIRALSPALSYDEGLRQIYDELMDLDSILSGVVREISGYQDDVVYDEEMLRELEARLDLINRLKAKYGNTIEKILSFYEEKQEELQKLQEYETRKKQAKETLEAEEHALRTAAAELSALRKEAAKAFETKIVQVLSDLNFLDVRFSVSFEENDKISKTGFDTIRFLIATNPGEPLRPLTKIASGGELSRIMLGLKTMFADRGGTETLIFDEIDAGISGRTAQKVSEKLAVISRHHQVICITHLPQIAAMADGHYYIEKTAEGTHTKTEIRLLDEEESVSELARMLGGAKITESVLKNAGEMKALAEETKKLNQ